jgi:hypothetical protein
MRSCHRVLRSGASALALVGLLLSSCSSGKGASTASSAPPSSAPDTAVTTAVTSGGTEVANTTAVPSVPVFPLTGLPLTDAAAGAKPALVVKIDNHPLARPQSGLNEADIVFEENVEQLTRFAAVFQSGSSNPVGPIRSGRTQDIALLGSLNRPLFAWSGGNARVTAAIQASDLRQLSALQQKVYFRAKGHVGPHDLYSSTDSLFALAPKDAGPPPVQFKYRAAGEVAAGDAVAGLNLSMDGVKASWHWDAAKGLFLRFTDGKVHSDAIPNAQVSTNNVVVLYVAYKPSPADPKSPEAQTIGKGDAMVYTDGKAIKATWTRADRLKSFTLTDASGVGIGLTPGRTFVELARTGTAASVPVGTAFNAVPFP